MDARVKPAHDAERLEMLRIKMFGMIAADQPRGTRDGFSDRPPV
jgi:hypothetical protein